MDSIVIGLVLVFNAVVGFFQEYRAERSLEALRRLATTQARVILIMFELQRGGGASLDEARSVALTTMVVFMVLHVGNSRSETLSAFAKDPFSNRFLFVGTLGAIAIHVAALYIPVTQLALDLEPIPLRTWLEIVAIAISVIVAVELHKLVRGRHPIRRSAADPSV